LDYGRVLSRTTQESCDFEVLRHKKGRHKRETILRKMGEKKENERKIYAPPSQALG
jgi:hypothetical protein